MNVARVLGKVSGARDGATLVLVGGIHGNEPAGVLASEKVLEAIAFLRLPVRGEIIALSGNRKALAKMRRYIDRDLNRVWPGGLGGMGGLGGPGLATGGVTPPEPCVEDAERDELMAILDPILRDRDQPVVVLDLHTTSSDTPPFICFADTLANRALALSVPIPAVLGLEEHIPGSMLGWVTERGHIAIGVEGGRHADPRSVTRHEAAIWQTLVAVGSLGAHEVPNHAEHLAHLKEETRGLPRVVEVRYRHVVVPGDEFEMEPDYRSFEKVHKGQVLAHDRTGPLRALEDARLLMPRYQSQGEDGFFLVSHVAKPWLHVSTIARHMGADRLVSTLPGVSRDPEDPDVLLVDPSVARTRVSDVMHLVGYRRARSAGKLVRYVRRHEPTSTPPPPPGAGDDDDD